MYEQRDTSVPRKHNADYVDRGNWGTTKTRNIHRVILASIVFYMIYRMCWFVNKNSSDIRLRNPTPYILCFIVQSFTRIIFVNVHATMNYEKNCMISLMSQYKTLRDKVTLCLIMSNPHIAYKTYITIINIKAFSASFKYLCLNPFTAEAWHTCIPTAELPGRGWNKPR